MKTFSQRKITLLFFILIPLISHPVNLNGQIGGAIKGFIKLLKHLDEVKFSKSLKHTDEIKDPADEILENLYSKKGNNLSYSSNIYTYKPSNEKVLNSHEFLNYDPGYRIKDDLISSREFFNRFALEILFKKLSPNEENQLKELEYEQLLDFCDSRSIELLKSIDSYYRMQNLFQKTSYDSYKISEPESKELLNRAKFIIDEIELITQIKWGKSSDPQTNFSNHLLPKIIEQSSIYEHAQKKFSSIGIETLTNESVLKFQVKNNLSPQDGFINKEVLFYIDQVSEEIIELKTTIAIQDKYLGRSSNLQELKSSKEIRFKNLLENHIESTKSSVINLKEVKVQYEKIIAQNKSSLDQKCNKLNLLGHLCPIEDSYQQSFDTYIKNNSTSYEALDNDLDIEYEQHLAILNKVLFDLPAQSDLSKLIESYSKLIDLPSTVFNESILKQLRLDEQVIYTEVDGKIERYEIEEITLKNDPEEVATTSVSAINSFDNSNVYIKYDKNFKQNLLKAKKYETWSLAEDEIIPLCLTQEGATIEELKRKWKKDNRIVYPSLKKTSKKLEKKLKKHRKKTIVAIGHVVDGKYVDENSNTSISIEELNDLAKKYDCNMLHMACGTALFEEGKRGTSDIINTYATAKWLSDEGKSQKNFKGFLTSLSNSPIGMNQDPVNILIDESSFANQDYAQFKIMQRNKKLGAATGATVVGFIYWQYQSKEDN